MATLNPGVAALAPQVAEAPASEDINILTPKAVAPGAVTAAMYVPAIVPGGELELPPPMVKPPMIAPPNEARPYYIVYHSREEVQGLFDHWAGPENDYGPKELCQGYAHRLYKKFYDYDTARMCYEEARESKVLDLLVKPPVPEETFIVIEGVQPGVYHKW